MVQGLKKKMNKVKLLVFVDIDIIVALANQGALGRAITTIFIGKGHNSVYFATQKYLNK